MKLPNDAKDTVTKDYIFKNTVEKGELGQG